MTQNFSPQTVSRIPVSLSADDNQLMIQLRAAMESRLNKRLSIAEIVRIALRTQAQLEGLNT